MKKNLIFDKVFPKIKKIVLLFFVFKIFILLFYFISNYQNFTNESISLILRILLANDSLLLFFCPITIFYIAKLKTIYIYKIIFILFLIINIIFCLLSILSISFIISFSN